MSLNPSYSRLACVWSDINHFLRVQVFVVLVFRHVSYSWRVSCSWHVSSRFIHVLLVVVLALVLDSCSCSCSCCCAWSCSCCCSCYCSCSSYSLCLIGVFKVSLDCSILSMMDECFAGDGLGAVCGGVSGSPKFLPFLFWGSLFLNWKLTGLAGKSPILRGDTSSNGCFWVVMLVFGGVYVCFFLGSLNITFLEAENEDKSRQFLSWSRGIFTTKIFGKDLD